MDLYFDYTFNFFIFSFNEYYKEEVMINEFLYNHPLFDLYVLSQDLQYTTIDEGHIFIVSSCKHQVDKFREW